VETTLFKRKPSYVQAVRVNQDNFLDVVAWCQGSIVTPGQTFSLDTLRDIKDKYISVRVANPARERQTKAYVGDWVIWSEYRGYQVYTNGAFHNAFLELTGAEKDAVNQSMKPQPEVTASA
jgi:hypothetical protein